MKSSKLILLVVLFASLSWPLHSEQGIWLTAEEWTLMQNLWLNSDQVYPHSMKTLNDLKVSETVTDSLLTNFEELDESDNTSLTNLEENNDEKTDISESLSLTSGNLETTTDSLETSFWESTGGKITIVVLSAIGGAATYAIVDGIWGN